VTGKARRRIGILTGGGDRLGPVAVPIADAVRRLKTAPLGGHRVRAARAMGLCLSD